MGKDNTVQASQNGDGTIFDDVFRTIAQKMPFLLIPLINEVFGTNYSEDQEFEQLRNEHYEKFGKVITDSIIKIGGHLYHIECQSKKDGSMALRMMEYDFAVAIEHSSQADDDLLDIKFPESCVLYLRNHRTIPAYHQARVTFADGQRVIYKVPVISAQDYTVNSIFEKNLLLLLPYHILRYENFLKTNGTNKKKLDALLDDYREINAQLSKLQEDDDRSKLYVDMIALINKIAIHVIPEDNPSRERIGDAMGGQILKLRSEELIEQGIAKGREEGRAEGKAEGRVNEIYSMVEDGDTTPERAARRLGITLLDLKAKMLAFGYRYPC